MRRERELGKQRKMSSLSGDRFKLLMRNVASSVAVITTTQRDKRHGMTATAVCGVSVDPASILVVVNRLTRSHPILVSSKTFTVNVLADDQQMIGKRFAAKLDEPFEGVEHRLGSIGGPIIAGSAAYFECSTVSEFDVGTHTIFIGEVLNGEASGAHPLIYHGGAYKTLSRHA